MSFVVNLISDLVEKHYHAESQQPVCNYQDNYYGDQVCVMSDIPSDQDNQ